MDNQQAIQFAIGAGGGAGGEARAGRAGKAVGAGPAATAPQWRCTLTDYTCTRSAAAGGGQAARDVRAVAARDVAAAERARAPRARQARRRCAFHPTSTGKR